MDASETPLFGDLEAMIFASRNPVVRRTTEVKHRFVIVGRGSPTDTFLFHSMEELERYVSNLGCELRGETIKKYSSGQTMMLHEIWIRRKRDGYAVPEQSESRGNDD